MEIQLFFATVAESGIFCGETRRKEEKSIEIRGEKVDDTRTMMKKQHLSDSRSLAQ